MRTYEQIIKDIKNTQNRIKDYEKQIENLNLYEDIRNAYKAGNQKEFERLHEQQKENDKQTIIISEKLYIEKVALLYLQDNKKVSLWEKCKQTIYETLQAYNNKPFGEKTKTKIYNAIREKTNCSIWIDCGGQYGNDKIHIRHMDDYYTDIKIDMSYENRLLIDNKINVTALQDAHMYEKYTENVKQAAKKLIALHKKARAKIEDAEKALSEYSRYAPSNINVNTYISNKPYYTIVTI